MAGNIEQLVDELERSYQEAQERMSDPAVYNDHREAAAAGRRLKELEGPHRLAREWRQLHDDLEAARGDGVLRELVPELEERSHAVEEELRVALAPTDPADSKDVIIEIRQGVGGDEAALWAGDLYRALTRLAEREHDRLRRPHHAPADGARRVDARREEPAPKPAEGPARAAGPPVRAGAREAAGRARRHPALADRVGRARGEDPHLQLPGKSH